MKLWDSIHSESEWVEHPWRLGRAVHSSCSWRQQVHSTRKRKASPRGLKAHPVQTQFFIYFFFTEWSFSWWTHSGKGHWAPGQNASRSVSRRTRPAASDEDNTAVIFSERLNSPSACLQTQDRRAEEFSHKNILSTTVQIITFNTQENIKLVTLTM